MGGQREERAGLSLLRVKPPPGPTKVADGHHVCVVTAEEGGAAVCVGQLGQLPDGGKVLPGLLIGPVAGVEKEGGRESSSGQVVPQIVDAPGGE